MSRKKLADDAKKHPGGRPSPYRPEYCDQIVTALGEGKSLLQFAVSIGVVKQTLHNWKEAHPEFLDAYTRAVAVGEAHWEGRLQQMMYDSKVNAPLVKLYFANRFGWHDKQAVDHTSTDGTMSPKAPRELSDNDLLAIINGKRG